MHSVHTHTPYTSPPPTVSRSACSSSSAQRRCRSTATGYARAHCVTTQCNIFQHQNRPKVEASPAARTFIRPASKAASACVSAAARRSSLSSSAIMSVCGGGGDCMQCTHMQQYTVTHDHTAPVGRQPRQARRPAQRPVVARCVSTSTQA
jgi:hypothetical protein